MRKATEDNRDLDQLAEYLESMDPTKVSFQNDDDQVALTVWSSLRIKNLSKQHFENLSKMKQILSEVNGILTDQNVPETPNFQQNFDSDYV